MKNIIVQDTGFVEDDWFGPLLDWDKVSQGKPDLETGYGLDVPNTVTAEQLNPYFNSVLMIRVSFPSFSDGRGFSIALTLRMMTFTGRLPAHGHLLTDQYTIARRVGFDEVEIDAALSIRQPEDQWLARANWQSHSYLDRLKASA